MIFWQGRLALAVALLLTAPAVARADWPVYGHDLANSRDAGLAGPSASQVKAVKQAWKFGSPSGDFTGTPVIAGGALVAGSNTGTVYALDAATGKLRWSRSVGQQVNGSAAIDLRRGLVFVPVATTGAPRLTALSLTDGSVRWSTTLTQQPGADVFGSPTFHDGVVYIGSSGPNSDASTARGTLTALGEQTGAIRWQTFIVPPGRDGGAVWSTPAMDTRTDRLYVGTGNAYHPPAAATTDSMMVLDARTGHILGHFQATGGDSFDAAGNPLGPDADFGASPNLIGSRLVGEGAKNGVYYTLDRASMKPLWRRQIGPGSAAGGILASTAFDGTRIYGTDTLDGQLFALDAAGSMRWVSLDPSTVDYSPVTVANGVLYSVDPFGVLVARDAGTGAPLAAMPLGGPDFGGISVVGKTIYAAIGTGPPPGLNADAAGSIVAFR